MPQPPMTRAGQPIHERILGYGGAGCGKTRAFLSIAKWHQSRGSDAIFYAISNDLSYERMLVPGGDFGDLENVIFENVNSMDEYIEAGRAFTKKMSSDDWLATDLLNGAWEAAQDEYAEKKWGVDLADYWVTNKVGKSGDADHPIEGWDWGPINKRYRYFAQNILMRCPGHLMCMSGEGGLKEASRSGKGGETAEVKGLFGRIGYKPLGQKDDPHRFHTIIHFTKSSKSWVMTSPKDRERTLLEGEKWSEFWLTYLVRIAGWRP